MKLVAKVVFSVYVALLLWLILFKTSYDIVSVFTSVHIRDINLIPFVGSVSGMVENFIIFIPLGLFLSMYFKKNTTKQKMLFIFLLSLTLEVAQYIFSIGMSDINDIITNTLGGLFGLGIYAFYKDHVDTKKMDRSIVIGMAVILILVLFLRFFVLRVKY